MSPLCPGLQASTKTEAPIAPPPSKMPTMTVACELNPPWQFEVDGRLVGINVDIVKALFAKAKVPYSLAMLPWQRAYKAAEEKKNHMVFTTIRRPDREELFQWIGTLGSSRWIFLGLADRSYEVDSLEDAKAYRIGGYYGDAKAKWLEENGVNVEKVADDKLNVAKLQKGRIDLWATGYVSGPALAAAAGVTDFKEVYTFHSVTGYLAVNKTTDPTIVQHLNKVLAEMHADGSVAAIIERYRKASPVNAAMPAASPAPSPSP